MSPHSLGFTGFCGCRSLFFFAILPQIYPISRKNHWKSHRPQAVTCFYIAYSIFFISLSVRS